MQNALIEVENLKKYFTIGHNRVLHAVDGVSFSIEEGKTLGLVGESGCGKTTVGRALIRLYEPDGGNVRLLGEDVSRMKPRDLARRAQMIFQDPYASLDPRKTVGAIVGEGLKIHKLCPDAKARQERVYELMEMVGLDREHASRFPHEFSGGQRQRVGIARALAVDPRFLICDEAISALDVSIQAQIINLLVKLQARLRLTYLFITHDLSVVKHISDDVAVMYLGQIVEKAPKTEMFANPLHPYSQGLLNAVPVPDPDVEQARPRILMSGEVPSPVNPAPGCRFRARCKHACARCGAETPALREVREGHFAACHLI